MNFLPPAFSTDQTTIVLSESNGTHLFVTDSDAGDASNFMVILRTSTGTLALVDGRGLTFTGNGTTASPLMLTGTLDTINTVLAAGLRLTTSPGFTGNVSLVIHSDDKGNTGTGGPLTDTDTLIISIGTDINDPPVNHLPAPITTELTTIILSSAGGNSLQVTDIDAGNANNFRVELVAADGNLSLENTAGITVAGNGIAVAPLILTGTLANINLALASGLTLTLPGGFVGGTSITITSNDRGNSGSGAHSPTPMCLT